MYQDLITSTALEIVPALIDGEAMARAHPDTFEMPSEEERRALMVGDLVKIGATGERFWCAITTIAWPEFTGTVKNTKLRPRLARRASIARSRLRSTVGVN